MRSLLIIWTFIFTGLAFLSTGFKAEIPVSVYNYFLYAFSQISANLILFVIVLILGSVYLLITRPKMTKSGSVWLNLQIMFISLISSGLIVFIIALVDLNVLALLINIDPKRVGLKTDSQQITSELKNMDSAPEIIASDIGGYELLRTIAVASSGKTNYFGKYLLPSIPDLLLIRIRSSAASLNLIDNTLIISYIDDDDLESISPVLAEKILQSYFSGLRIKSNSNIKILDKQAYNEFRMKEVQKKNENISSEILKLDQQLLELGSESKTIESNLSDTNSRLESIYKQREAEHQSCLSLGKYVAGKFQRINTDAVCREKYDSFWVKVNIELEKINLLESEALVVKDQIGTTHTFLSFIKAQQSVLKALENNIPNEYGAFQPPDSIGVAFTPNSPNVLVDYLGTLVHEYLHYASFISEDKILSDAFFEEGFTEYFSRQAIKKHLKTSPNIGYPAITRIITQLGNRIPESELVEIYFKKDQQLLEKVLNRAFGDDFYKRNRILFLSLQYANNPNDMLKYANLIMQKIGGDPLTSTDISSTSTTF